MGLFVASSWTTEGRKVTRPHNYSERVSGWNISNPVETCEYYPDTQERTTEGKSNYRPISVLRALSKILEKHV